MGLSRIFGPCRKNVPDNDKFDIDFGPSMEIKDLCSKKISKDFVPCKSKRNQNLGLMDEYDDLFLELVSCTTLGKTNYKW